MAKETKMVKYEVNIDGQKYEIDAEEDATEAEIEAALFEYLDEERSAAGNVLRTGEYAARGAVDTGAEVLGAIPELVASGLRTVGAPAPEPGYYPEAIKSGIRSAGQAISTPLNILFPKAMSGPMTARDEMAYQGGKGAASAASVFLPAAALAKTAQTGTTAANVLQALAKQKGLQTLAGTTGGIVEGATDSPVAGMAASMAVPFAALVPAAAKNATVVALRRAGLKENAPTTDILKAQKATAYQNVKDIEGEVKPGALQRLRNELEPAMEAVGFDKFDTAAKPRVVLASIEKMIQDGKSLDLQTIENIRRRIGKAIQDTVATPGDQKVAMTMRDQFDNWFEGLAAKDITVRGQEVVGPVVENAAAAALKVARAANVKFRKSETIEEIVTNAEMQASGFENGLRIGFRQLLKNKKRIKGFSQDEQNIMREIVDGNAATNLARLIGKFGFNITGKGSAPNIVGAGIGGAAGYQYDPLAALAVPAVGTGSKFLADRLARNTADYLRAMAATGGKDVAPRSRVSPRPGLLGAVGLQNLVP